MIAETTQHARFGAQPGQLAKAGVQRIAPAADKIARHQADVGACFIGHVHRARKFGLAQKRAQMNIGHLHDPQTVQVLGQFRNVDFDFGQLQTAALQNAEPGCSQRRYGKTGSRGLKKATPGWPELGDLRHASRARPTPISTIVSRMRGAFQPRRPPNREKLLDAMEFEKVAQNQHAVEARPPTKRNRPRAVRSAKKPQNQKLKTEAENQQTKPRKKMHAVKH